MIKFQHTARQTAARKPQMKPAPLLLAAALLALLGTGQAVQAQAIACNGQTIATGNNTSGHPYGPHLLEMEIPTVLGDRITVISGRFAIDDYTGRGTPGTLTAGQTFTVTQEIVDLRGPRDGHHTYIQNDNFLRNPDPYAAPILTYLPSSFRCDSAASLTPPVAKDDTPRAAANSMSSQSTATQSAINTNVAARFGNGGGFNASSNGVFVSSRGLDAAANSLGEPELNVWVSAEGRRFTGSNTGDSQNLTLGADRLLTADFLIGGYIGVNTQSLTSAGSTTDSQSPLLGIYAARSFNETLFLSGFAGFGKPEYTQGPNTATGSRSVMGLSLNGEAQTTYLRIQPSVSVLAARENVPALGGSAAATLEHVSGSLALRAQPLNRYDSGMLPYVSLAADFSRQSLGAVETDSFTKPRFGFGADWQLVSGTLRLDVDYGTINSGTNDLGAALTYDFRF